MSKMPYYQEAEYFPGRRILGHYGRKIFRVELATQLKLKKIVL
jgi:hypothetical protein